MGVVWAAATWRARREPRVISMAATAAVGAYPMNDKHVQRFVAKGTCTADWLSYPVLSLQGGSQSMSMATGRTCMRNSIYTRG